MRFRAEQHLRRQSDFQHVRTHGRRHECGAFTLWYVRQAAPVAVGEPKPGVNPDVVTKTTAKPSEASGISPATETKPADDGSHPRENASASSADPSASKPFAPPAPALSALSTASGSLEKPAPARVIESAPSRLGVVASRSAVGNAIARARAKRRLREVFRNHQQRVPAGYDLLLVARGALNRLEYREIEKRFVDACSKIFPSAKA